MTSPAVRARARGVRRAAAVVATLAVVAAGGACADVWAYLDAQGRPHFATHQLDARYQLFFKGSSSLDPPPSDAAAADARAALAHSPLYRRLVAHPNVRRFAPLLERYAAEYGLDVALLKAMVAVESAYDPSAVSDKGAVGLMQVLPTTGIRYGVTADARRSVAQKLADPTLNVSVGARYLRDLLAMFGDDRTLALAAYNAGEQAVRQYGNRVPPFPETQDYVELVRQFEGLYRPPPPPRAAPPRPTLDLPGRRAAAAPT